MPMKVSNGYTQEVYNQTRSIMLSSPVDFCCIAAEGFWIKTFYKSIPPNDPPHGYLFFFTMEAPQKYFWLHLLLYVHEGIHIRFKSGQLDPCPLSRLLF